jgi:hypothetical protein
MTNERNQDPQDPTRDQPPPKQYATPRPGESKDRGTDQKTPRIPDHMETSEGDDENQIASSEGAVYDEDASTKGATGRSSSEKASTPSGQRGAGSATQKPDAGSSQSSGSGSRQTPGSTGSGSPSGSSSGGRSNK